MVPLTDVLQLEMRRSDGLKTVGLLALIAAVAWYPVLYLFFVGGTAEDVRKWVSILGGCIKERSAC